MSRFSLVPRVNLPRSKFDLSFEHKTTLNAGKLVPVCVQEILPGDSLRINQTSLIRFASSLVTPLMDNCELKFEWFFVPNRLVWKNWERMMGQQDEPDDSIDYLVPSIKNFNTNGDGFFRYLLPPGVGLEFVNILPLRAYAKIYNDWYRDENLCGSYKAQCVGLSGDVYKAGVESVLGTDDCSVDASSMGFQFDRSFILADRAKKHDYFTSCLPWPQKGPGVELPLGQIASLNVANDFTMPVLWGDVNYGPYDQRRHNGSIGNGDSGLVYDNQNVSGIGVSGETFKLATSSTNYNQFSNNSSSLKTVLTKQQVENGIQVDLTSATAITINSLRQAFQIQKFYEACARGGTRYTEIVRSFFGVVSPDARLQRSEYFGGFSSPLQFHSVAQTSATNETSPQGNLTSFGIGINQNKAFSRSFTEHGFVMCLASVVSTPSYSQGLDRYLSRQGRMDYYWTTFAHLGEQAVLMKEIYAKSAKPNDVFGYQERYAEYRYNSNKLTGQMAVDNDLALTSWTLSQKFTSEPALNADFIRENPPIDRVVAVGSGTGADQFILDVYFKIDAVRVMPVYGVPGLVDHF